MDNNVSVLNYHYAYPPKTVTDNYKWNKPVAFDETADGQNAPDRRREAWAFMMEGGAVYNNLDWSYANDDITGMGRNPWGERQSGKEVREQLRVLVKTINSFSFINARPLDSSYKQNLPEGVNLHGLGISGKDYLVYWIKSKPGSVDQWICPLPQGVYLVKWFDPLNGHVLQEKIIHHKGEKLTIRIPEFSDDLALRITAVKK